MMFYEKIKLILLAVNILHINASCGSICSHTLRNTEIISRQIDTNYKAISNLKLEIDQILNLLTSPPPANPPLFPPTPYTPPTQPASPTNPIPPYLPPVPPLSPPSIPSPSIPSSSVPTLIDLSISLINTNSEILLNLILIFTSIAITIGITLAIYTILKRYVCHNKRNPNTTINLNNQKQYSTVEYFNKKNLSSLENNLV